jgi:hypothetical protein
VWDGYGVLIMFFIYGVHRFESSQLLDMSNGLSYGSQHIDNLIELMVKV